MKISDKLAAAVAAKEVFFSFEYFPPSSSDGISALHARMDAMAKYEPLFVAVTWPGIASFTPALDLAVHALKVRVPVWVTVARAQPLCVCVCVAVLWPDATASSGLCGPEPRAADAHTQCDEGSRHTKHPRATGRRECGRLWRARACG